jgi:membrane protease subunit (stomatin/prohibitin family)
MNPAFTALGLALNQFVVENISLPDELQKLLDQRIGMNMVGDLGRFTQFSAAESMQTAAANTSGAAGMGMGLGAGAAVAQVLSTSLKPAAAAPAETAAAAPQAPAVAESTKFCIECGKPIPLRAKFCTECGKPQ